MNISKNIFVIILILLLFAVAIYKFRSKLLKRNFIVVFTIVIMILILYMGNKQVNNFISAYLFSDKEYLVTVHEKNLSIKLPSNSLWEYKSPTDYYSSLSSLDECENFFKTSLRKMKEKKEVKEVLFNNDSKVFTIIINEDTGIAIKLIDDHKYRFAITNLEGFKQIGEYIFFIDSDNEIYRTNIKINEKIRISKNKENNHFIDDNFKFKIAKDNLFYIASSSSIAESEYYLYSIDLNSFEIKKVISTPIIYKGIYVGYIYYLDQDYNLKRINLDSFKIDNIMKLDSPDFYIKNGYIIYEKIDKDTKKQETVRLRVY